MITSYLEKSMSGVWCPKCHSSICKETKHQSSKINVSCKLASLLILAQLWGTFL